MRREEDDMIFDQHKAAPNLHAEVRKLAWRRHYNTVRPHSSLGYLTPHEFKSKNEQLTLTRPGGIAL